MPRTLTLTGQALIDLSDVVAAFRRAGIGGPLEVAQRRRAPDDEGVEREQFPAVSHPEAVELALVVFGQAVQPQHQPARSLHEVEETVVEYGFGDCHEVIQTVSKVALDDRVGAQVAPFYFEGEDFLFAR